MKKRICMVSLLLLSALATMKMIFLNLGIDEEYAVTMAFRMVNGDRMFVDMWEPHQTSGFLSALFIRIFIGLTGGTDYLIIYLRIVGSVLQAIISLFLYRTLKLRFSKEVSFVAAVFFYNTLPKWIQTPEFANMLVWFSTLVFLCCFRYYTTEGRRPEVWLVGTGLNLCGMVLAYPSTIIAVPVVLMCMWRLRGRDKNAAYSKSLWYKESGIIVGTCGVAAVLYVMYFLRHMSFSDFVYGLKQMMTDGTHSETFIERVLVYGKEIWTLLPYIITPVLLATLMVVLFPGLRRMVTAWNMIVVAAIGMQLLFWLSDNVHMQQPLVYYYFVYIAGICLFRYVGHKGMISKEEEILFWTGSIFGGCVWLCALAITNTTISVTGSYLMPGILSGIVLLCRNIPVSEKEDKSVCVIPGYISYIMILGILGITLFAKGFLICASEGRKENVFCVKQKALDGPAKGIYCRYVDGYTYNLYGENVLKYTHGRRILYIGQRSIYYLVGEQAICNYSTISTPTYDERLLEYWERNPLRIPQLIVCDTDGEELETLEKMLELGELLEEIETLEGMTGIKVYEVSGIRK